MYFWLVIFSLIIYILKQNINEFLKGLIMEWTKLNFGKHEGKTLPQIMFIDADWFFWGWEKKIFNDKGQLKKEAEEIYKKATNIKIPYNQNNDKEIEYIIHYPTYKFQNFQIVDKSKPIHQGSSQTERGNYIDMSYPKKLKGYDKLGCKNFVKSHVDNHLPQRIPRVVKI